MVGKYREHGRRYQSKFKTIRAKNEHVEKIREILPDTPVQDIISDALEHYIRYTKRKRITERRRAKEEAAA